MKTMNKERFEQMKKQAEEVLTKREAGVSNLDLIAQIYMDGLDNKSMEQGLMMANEAVQAVKDFNQSYSEAVENKDGTMDKLIDQLLENKSAAERCNILTQLYAAVTTASAKASGEECEEGEKLVNQADEDPITEEQASPELEAEIRARAIEALNRSSILSHGLFRQADQLDALASELGVTQMVLQIGQDQIEYESILTMLSYVESKNGTIEELPPDLTIQEVAYVVAATVEEEQIVKRFTMGEMAMEAAVALLDILGMVMMIKFAAWIVGKGVMVAAGMGGLILAAPALVLLVAGCMAAMSEAVNIWDGGVRLGVKAASTVVRVGVRVAAAGLRKIGEFVQNTVAPVAIAAVKKAWSFVRHIMGMDAEETVEVEENTVVGTI